VRVLPRVTDFLTVRTALSDAAIVADFHVKTAGNTGRVRSGEWREGAALRASAPAGATTD